MRILRTSFGIPLAGVAAFFAFLTLSSHEPALAPLYAALAAMAGTGAAVLLLR